MTWDVRFNLGFSVVPHLPLREFEINHGLPQSEPCLPDQAFDQYISTLPDGFSVDSHYYDSNFGICRMLGAIEGTGEKMEVDYNLTGASMRIVPEEVFPLSPRVGVELSVGGEKARYVMSLGANIVAGTTRNLTGTIRTNGWMGPSSGWMDDTSFGSSFSTEQEFPIELGTETSCQELSDAPILTSTKDGTVVGGGKGKVCVKSPRTAPFAAILPQFSIGREWRLWQSPEDSSRWDRHYSGPDTVTTRRLADMASRAARVKVFSYLLLDEARPLREQYGVSQGFLRSVDADFRTLLDRDKGDADYERVRKELEIKTPDEVASQLRAVGKETVVALLKMLAKKTAPGELGLDALYLCHSDDPLVNLGLFKDALQSVVRKTLSLDPLTPADSLSAAIKEYFNQRGIDSDQLWTLYHPILEKEGTELTILAFLLLPEAKALREEWELDKAVLGVLRKRIENKTKLEDPSDEDLNLQIGESLNLSTVPSVATKLRDELDKNGSISWKYANHKDLQVEIRRRFKNLPLTSPDLAETLQAAFQVEKNPKLGELARAASDEKAVGSPKALPADREALAKALGYKTDGWTRDNLDSTFTTHPPTPGHTEFWAGATLGVAEPLFVGARFAREGERGFNLSSDIGFPGYSFQGERWRPMLIPSVPFITVGGYLLAQHISSEIPDGRKEPPSWKLGAELLFDPLALKQAPGVSIHLSKVFGAGK